MTLFDWIAPFYALFYPYQRKRYAAKVGLLESAVPLPARAEVLDIGSGTGALAAAFALRGHRVQGVDAARCMVRLARILSRGSGVRFQAVHPGEPLPFPDKSFDLAVSSYVLHGMNAEARGVFLAEAARTARTAVALIDYAQTKEGERHPLTEFVERMEGGDYLRFIRTGLAELRAAFETVTVIPLSEGSALYLCRPHPCYPASCSTA
jgi:SAM-dependent methyltransferase